MEKLNFVNSENQYIIDNNDGIDTIIDNLKNIFDFEQSNNVDIQICCKNIDTDKLTKIFDYCLSNYQIINSTVILNILNLVKGYNAFEQEFFDHKLVWFTDIEQVIDVKLELQDKISNFVTDLSKYFIGCIKSMHKVEYTYLDDIVKLPPLFNHLFLSTDMLTLSGIMSKSNNFSINECPLIEDSYIYVSELASKFILSNSLSKMFDNVK